MGRRVRADFDEIQKENHPEPIASPGSQKALGWRATFTTVLIQIPATAVLIVVNLYIFLRMMGDIIVLASAPDANLDENWAHGFWVAWGGNLGTLTLHGEPWRLVTAMFLHGGLGHIAGNMICLWFWGKVTERALGTSRFLLAYFAFGVLGNLAAVWVRPDVISVGASGALAGLLGLMVVIWSKGDVRVSPKNLFATIMLNAAFSLHAGVSWEAHLGGFVAGLGFGMLLFPDSFVQRPPNRADADVECRLAWISTARNCPNAIGNSSY